MKLQMSATKLVFALALAMLNICYKHLLNYLNLKAINKVLLVLILVLILQSGYGQDIHREQARTLTFDSIDLKIIQKADAILSDSTKWNKDDDRQCEDDISTGRYSLYCALYKAAIEIAGEFDHRKPALQVVRFTLEKYDNGRVKDHRLMDWNNHPNTTFAELKEVLKESSQVVQKQPAGVKKTF